MEYVGYYLADVISDLPKKLDSNRLYFEFNCKGVSKTKSVNFGNGLPRFIQIKCLGSNVLFFEFQS